MFTAIAGIISGLGGQWMENRRQVSVAKHEQKLAKITHISDWETEQAKSGQNSWKDEFVTIFMAAPYGVLFIAALFDKPDVIDRVDYAFEVMGKTPDWFHWTFVTVMLAAVGVRATKAFLKRK
jgi:hypothetical protein